MGVSKELLEILACPACKDKLFLAEDETWLICRRCKLKYPIKEDIPVMLTGESEALNN